MMRYKSVRHRSVSRDCQSVFILRSEEGIPTLFVEVNCVSDSHANAIDVRCGLHSSCRRPAILRACLPVLSQPLETVQKGGRLNTWAPDIVLECIWEVYQMLTVDFRFVLAESKWNLLVTRSKRHYAFDCVSFRCLPVQFAGAG